MEPDDDSRKSCGLPADYALGESGPRDAHSSTEIRMLPGPGDGPPSWLDGCGHRLPDPIDIPSDQFVTLDGVRFHYPRSTART